MTNIAEKKGVLEIDNSFSRYMVARYLSFQHPTFALLLEEINRLWDGIDDQMFYMHVYHTIPAHRMDFKKYVKKVTQKKKPQAKVVEVIAHDLQISQREVLQYLEMDPTLKKDWDKMSKVNASKK